MKKIIIGLFILTIVINIFKNKEDFLIPDEALRFRVIANSNSLEDQLLKSKVKNNVETEIFKLLKDVDSYSDAKEILENNTYLINEKVSQYTNDYQINVGKNYFPEKEYKGVTYEAGEYDSLVITLGSGVGNNWWCVLFPPLCMIEEQENSMEDYDYQLYISKFFQDIKH
ncbi:MAG: stage II sporulation protein R [Bacilli bacterium]|nr:stage II sporulation protein R [Bacilli bacterium]